MQVRTLIGGIGCLLFCWAGCSQKKAATPPAPASAPAVVSGAATTPAPAAATPQAGQQGASASSEKRCIAKTGASVHLRQSEQEKASGPQLPAGTEVIVLTRGKLERKGLPIFQVQVKSGAQTGYVFLSERELGAGCPFVWPDPNPPKKAEPEDSKLEGTSQECFRSGTVAELSKLYAPGCVSDHGKPEPAKYKLDVDGDGRIDELLDYADSLVLALHTARGYKALLLGQGMDTEHHDGAARWLEPVRAGDKVYLATSYHETESFDDSSTEISSFSLDLVRPDGKVYGVFNVSIEGADLDLQFRGNPDGSVVLTNGKGRDQTLHWNAALERFLP